MFTTILLCRKQSRTDRRSRTSGHNRHLSALVTGLFVRRRALEPTGKLLTPGDKLLEFRVTSCVAPDLTHAFAPTPCTIPVRFEAGYPACVPDGLGDVCAAASRPVRGIVDGALLVPIRLGDHVTAQGALEVVDGVRIFSAHTLVDHTSPLAPGR